MKLLSLVQILRETVDVAYVTATLRYIAKRLQAVLHFAASYFD